MTDQELFDDAVYWAKTRQSWLQCAAAPTPDFPRRRCLRLARQAAARVVNLSIRAEQRCLRELDVAGAAA